MGGMKPTFSGRFTFYGNSAYILFPKNILDIAKIEADTALFSAEVDRQDENGPVEVSIRIWPDPMKLKSKPESRTTAK